MASFSKMMLIEGLEEILTNPKFEAGVNIVTTISALIDQGIVENEGKVKTIISERSFEGHHEDEEGTGETGETGETEEHKVSSAEPHPAKAAPQAPPPPPVSAFPKVVEIAKALDAKMQASPTLVEPELVALMAAISKNVNLADRLAEQTAAGDGGAPAYPAAITTVAELLVDKLQDDEEKTLHFLEELYPFITSGELPKAEAGLQFSEQTMALMQRIERLPERYTDILLQLLGNWEKQAK